MHVTKVKQISPSSVKAIFTDTYKGVQNFMTPNSINWGFIKRDESHLAWELSEGTGLLSVEMIYGVTVLEVNSIGGVLNKRHDLSKGGFSKEEAEQYIKSLKTVQK